MSILKELEKLKFKDESKRVRVSVSLPGDLVKEVKAGFKGLPFSTIAEISLREAIKEKKEAS